MDKKNLGVPDIDELNAPTLGDVAEAAKVGAKKVGKIAASAAIAGAMLTSGEAEGFASAGATYHEGTSEELQDNGLAALNAIGNVDRNLWFTMAEIAEIRQILDNGVKFELVNGQAVCVCERDSANPEVEVALARINESLAQIKETQRQAWWSNLFKMMGVGLGIGLGSVAGRGRG